MFSQVQHSSQEINYFVILNCARQTSLPVGPEYNNYSSRIKRASSQKIGMLKTRRKT